MARVFVHTSDHSDASLVLAYLALALSLAFCGAAILAGFPSWLLLLLGLPATYGALRLLRDVVVQVDDFRPILAKARAAATLPDIVPYIPKLPEGFVMQELPDRATTEHKINAHFYRAYLAGASRGAWIVLGANVLTGVVSLLLSLRHPQAIDPLIHTIYAIALLLCSLSLASVYLAVRIDASRQLHKFGIETSERLIRAWYPIVDAAMWILYASLVTLAAGLATRLMFLLPTILPAFKELAMKLATAVQ